MLLDFVLGLSAFAFFITLVFQTVNSVNWQSRHAILKSQYDKALKTCSELETKLSGLKADLSIPIDVVYEGSAVGVTALKAAELLIRDLNQVVSSDRSRPVWQIKIMLRYLIRGLESRKDRFGSDKWFNGSYYLCIESLRQEALVFDGLNNNGFEYDFEVTLKKRG